MDIIVGGVPRKINMVKKYSSSKNTKAESVKNIFTNSRADRLYKKEMQKRVDREIKKLYTTGSAELPIPVFVDLDKPPAEFIGGSNAETAANIEYYYANSANDLFS